MEKRNDMILIGAFLLLAIIVFFLVSAPKDEGDTAIIKIDGEVHEEFLLSEERTYTIDLDEERYNVLVIKNGYVQMSEASCPDHICVNHRPIQKSGETIVCLPNRLVIEIESANESDTTDCI